MRKTTRFPELRAELRQREAHSKTIGKRIRETSGEVRIKLWEEKRAYGSVTRCVLLAYAFLRGMPREKCEPIHGPQWLAYSVWFEAKRFVPDADRKLIADWFDTNPTPASQADADAEALPSGPS